MTPSQTPQAIATGGINIDQMLQNLSTQPPIETTAINNVLEYPSVVQQQPVLGNTFSIDALSKPSIPEPSSPGIVSQKKFFPLPMRAKTTASVVSTFLLLLMGGFVLKTTYPVETKNFTDKFFGVVDTVVTTTNNNMQNNEIIITNAIDMSGSIEDVHGAAPDNYITDTPLADALTQSQDILAQDTSTDQMIATATSDIISSSDTGSILVSGSNDIDVSSNITITDMQFPSIEKSQTNEQLKSKLLVLSQSAEEAITNLIGNSDVKMAKMRVVYKKSQALITQLSDGSFVPDDDFRDQVIQLQTLYDGTIVQ